MKINLLKVLVAFMFITTTSCVHSNKTLTKSVEIESNVIDGADVLNINDLLITSKVYSDERYPLSDFFKKLLKGDFKESFKKANLSYKPSNTKNEMLKNLLSSGLVPVYVSVKNTSNSATQVSYEQFSLTDGRETYKSLNPINLPKQIQQFSSDAMASNVINGVLVVSVVVVFIILIAYAPNGIHSTGGNNLFGGDLFTDNQKTTKIDYKNYVISKKTLAPGEELAGLLFFNMESMQDTSDYKIKYGETLP